MVIVENMLRGLPVVASNLGAYSEVLGDAGVTFRVGDSQDLARQLSRLIGNIATARTLGQAGRERALKLFSVQEMIDRHEAIYRRIAVAK
jgi:glycosyltransferase involved in cell wall biosynthesis